MGLVLLDVAKPILSPQKDISIDIPGYPGSVRSSKKFIDNNITVNCLIAASSYSDLLTKLKALSAYLYSDDDKVLSFDDESDRYYNAQHINTVIGKRNCNLYYIDLVFTCNDPFAYDTTATSDNQTITVNSTTKVIANAGQYYAFPIVTITFVQTQTHIYIENDNIADNRFDISKAFNISDVLIIDCKNKTIKLNGIADYSGFGDGGEGLAEWLMLAAGNNSITTGTTDATINVTVNISFDKVYFY